MTIPTSAPNDFPGNATPAQLLYPDLAQELALTRGMIARVPDGKNDWKPHQKSMSLGGLAAHVAQLPQFATIIFSTAELDWATTEWKPTSIDSTAARLETFDDLAAKMTSAIQGADWAALGAFWVMRSGDQIFIKERKATLLRTLGLNHIAHHRAQLGVFLRLLGVAIPGTYGPSADEM